MLPTRQISLRQQHESYTYSSRSLASSDRSHQQAHAFASRPSAPSNPPRQQPRTVAPPSVLANPSAQQHQSYSFPFRPSASVDMSLRQHPSYSLSSRLSDPPDPPAQQKAHTPTSTPAAPWTQPFSAFPPRPSAPPNSSLYPSHASTQSHTFLSRLSSNTTAATQHLPSSSIGIGGGVDPPVTAAWVQRHFLSNLLLQQQNNFPTRPSISASAPNHSANAPKNKFTLVKASSKAAKAKAMADAQLDLRRAMVAKLREAKRQSRPRSGSPISVNMTDLVAVDKKQGNKQNKSAEFVKAADKQGAAQKNKSAAPTPQAGSQSTLADLFQMGKNKPAASLKPETTLQTAQAAPKPAPPKKRNLVRRAGTQDTGSPLFAAVASGSAVGAPNPVSPPKTTAHQSKTRGRVKLVMREDEHGNLVEDVSVVEEATGRRIDVMADSDSEEEQPAAVSQKKTVATRVLAAAMRGIFGAQVTVNGAESIQIDELTLTAKPKLGAAGWAFIDLLAEHAQIEPVSTGRSGCAPSSPPPCPVIIHRQPFVDVPPLSRSLSSPSSPSPSSSSLSSLSSPLSSLGMTPSSSRAATPPRGPPHYCSQLAVVNGFCSVPLPVAQRITIAVSLPPRVSSRPMSPLVSSCVSFAFFFFLLSSALAINAISLFFSAQSGQPVWHVIQARAL
ncbi:hypothetical protein BCR44DRAFT_56499 [Catenaria anguillulae PL171]|uniref:Uncharacterized protein n=1 Tax=Catenaria anguillulae PL171 TaxID=765915 RepID=A0A1Y2H9R4_9FUNG|nr:hypothetical protein BCR44DRAFT_56499 [Catenaria anguillulae PL171]